MFSLLRFTSILSGSYIGYVKRDYIKLVTDYPIVKPYKPTFSNNPNITEDRFNGMIAGCCGLLVGNYLWPLVIPYTIYYIDQNYGKEIVEIIEKLRKP